MAVKQYYFKNINFHKCCIADSRHLEFEGLNMSESNKNNTGNVFPKAKLVEKDTLTCPYSRTLTFSIIARFRRRPIWKSPSSGAFPQHLRGT